MITFSATVTDAELIAFLDRWAALLESEDYQAAFAHTAHGPATEWTPALVREVIKGYSNATSSQRVTVQGVPTDTAPRKDVTRWPTNSVGSCGEIWYDLNIDGKASDLTAIFSLQWAGDGIRVCLDDIHVM